MTTDVAIIGAGPIGLELAVALREADVDYLQFEAGQIGQTITWFPKQAQFFSSPQRIAICGVPFHTSDQSKATREEYLAYLRGVVQQFDLPIRTYERVLSIEPTGEGFKLTTQTARGEHVCTARRVVVTMGDMHRPRKLNVEGEDLPHVSHYFDDPHPYFRRKVLIVGGRNSAVEAAIRCHRAGAQVAMSYRKGHFDDRAVKYWLRPEIEWLIRAGEVAFYPRSTPVKITPTSVTLAIANGGGKPATCEVETDFVLLLTGYEMDAGLLTQAGVELFGPNDAPTLNPQTMETNVPGLYVAGTAVAGSQQRFKLFIENCHSHVVRIARALTGKADFSPNRINPLAYSRLDEHPSFEEAPADKGQSGGSDAETFLER